MTPADIGGALGARQRRIDIPVGHHQAEVVERHFRKAVDAGLIGSGFFAAVVDGKNFASNRFGSGLVRDGLRLRTGRERKRTNNHEAWPNEAAWRAQ
jgi:hypothetical protein